jgi:hypothetical protein
MARTFTLLVLVTALALPATLSAASSTDGTLSVKRGHGVIVSKVRGTVIGSLAVGTVRIKDLTPFDGQSPRFRHCRTLRPINPSTTVCKGRKISFRALSGPYVVTTRGAGTFLSEVGHGSVMFDGVDTAPTGVMSFDSGPYQPIPVDPTTYQLGTSTPGR